MGKQLLNGQIVQICFDIPETGESVMCGDFVTGGTNPSVPIADTGLIVGPLR